MSCSRWLSAGGRRRPMLVRQRIILSLLSAAGGSAGRTQLMKWAFLMKQETDVESVARFYDFVPYRYGPYSFALNQEMDSLLRDGYVRTTGPERQWRLTDAGKSAAQRLSGGLRMAVRSITEQYGDKIFAEVLAHVYDCYPWFTANSEDEDARRGERSGTVCKVYSLGYEGASVDRFLNEIMRYGIQTVIDVRNNPVSRRYGFHKATLTRLCIQLKLGYEHFPELGIPSELREQAARTTVGYDALFDRYARDTLTREKAAVYKVADVMKNRASVLVCTETDPASCHRSRLAESVAQRTNLPVEHLYL